ncbi:MAG: hypothetical protein AB8H86_27220 [Polyangiales bacterium]
MRSALTVLLFGSLLALSSLQMGCALIGATVGAATNGRQGLRRGFRLGAQIDGAVIAVAAATQRHRLGEPRNSTLGFYQCQTEKQPVEPRFYQVASRGNALRACESYFDERCVCEEHSVEQP